MNTIPLPTAEPRQVELAVDPAIQETAQQSCQSLSQAKERWQCYLNWICLDTVVNWLQEEEVAVKPQHRQSLLTVCPLVNGTAITLDEARLVLIPSEAMDAKELRVPQEWMDIPSWAGDYYFAVQVNPDTHQLCLWGYATHAQLQEKSNYDPNNRCYVLAAQEMVNDLTAFWVARELCPDETTRTAIPALATLPLQQAENLLQRLGRADILEPRLTIPFERWGALLEHDGWRQRLYEYRQGYSEQRSIFQWLQWGVSKLAQQLGWQQLDWHSQLAGARGADAQQAAIGFCRPLTINGKSYELQVIPVGNPQDRVWRFQLQPTGIGEMIPAGITLRLLSEDLQPFDNNEATATAPTEQLYLEVALVAGEGVVWETEPQSEGYEREILRF